MAEFEMLTYGKVDGAEWRDLDHFTRGFIEAAFFTETCTGVDRDAWDDPEEVEAREEGQADGVIPNDAGFADIASESLAAIRAYCEAWQAAHADLLAAATLHDDDYSGRVYDDTRAGHDLWYTHNGHGVGYWDRGLGDIGDKLSEAAGRGEISLWWDGDSVTFEGVPSVAESA